jgi:hypothetical protein
MDTRPPHRDPAEVRELHFRVWDLVKHLVHPAALYVVLELLVAGHLGENPALSSARHGSHLWALLFAGQFLGAWAVFYSTLLRDAGIRSYTALALTGMAAFGLAAQLVAFPDPAAMSPGWIRLVLAWHLVPAVALWVVTMVRWTRLKRRLARLIDGERPGGATRGDGGPG